MYKIEVNIRHSKDLQTPLQIIIRLLFHGNAVKIELFSFLLLQKQGLRAIYNFFVKLI